MGMPAVLITGDSEGIREAQELLGSVPVVTVKQSKGEFNALCYQAEEIRLRIKESVGPALDRLLKKKPVPFIFSPLVRLVVRLSEGAFVRHLRETTHEALHDENVLCFEGDSLRRV
jgi:D-aminopeptidase